MQCGMWDHCSGRDVQFIFECGNVQWCGVNVGVMWNGAPRCGAVIYVNYGAM